jgi:hypothetical protein
MALTGDRLIRNRAGKRYSFPVAANAVIYAGALVALNASGFAVPASTATTQKVAGVAVEAVTGTASNGGVSITVERGVWQFKNSADADLIALSDLNGTAYIVDDETVAKTNGGATRSIAGVIRDVDGAGVWIEI